MIVHVFILLAVFLVASDPNKPPEVLPLAGSFGTLEACQAAAKDTVAHLRKKKPEDLQAASLACVPIDLKTAQ